MKEHCCKTMSYWANYTCPEHPDPFDCPDNIISFSAKGRSYGIIIHDGGSSKITIKHCPWCGSKLSSVKIKVQNTLTRHSTGRGKQRRAG